MFLTYFVMRSGNGINILDVFRIILIRLGVNIGTSTIVIFRHVPRDVAPSPRVNKALTQVQQV